MANALASLTGILVLREEEDTVVLVCSHWVIPPDDENSEEEVSVICVYRISKATDGKSSFKCVWSTSIKA